MKPSRALVAVVSGLVAAVVLVGCSSKTPVSSSELATGAAASAAADDGGDNLGATMPKDFPAEVPLPEAVLTNATTLNAVGKRSWTLNYEVNATTAQEIFRAVVQAMRDKGFTATVIADDPDDGGAIFTQGPFNIVLTSGTAELQLTVSRAAV